MVEQAMSLAEAQSTASDATDPNVERAKLIVAAAQAVLAAGGSADDLNAKILELGGVELSSSEAALAKGFLQAAMADRQNTAAAVTALAAQLTSSAPAATAIATTEDAPKAVAVGNEFAQASAAVTSDGDKAAASMAASTPDQKIAVEGHGAAVATEAAKPTDEQTKAIFDKLGLTEKAAAITR